MIIIISAGTNGRTDYRVRTKTAAAIAANEKAAKVNYNLFRSSGNERANERNALKKQKAKEGRIITGHRAKITEANEKGKSLF